MTIHVMKTWSPYCGAIGNIARKVWASPWGKFALTAIFLAIACQGFYSAGKRRGRDVEAAKCKEQAQRALVVAQEANRKMEMTHAQQVQDLQTSYALQQQQAASVDARAAADLGSGARRLRFPVASRCPAAPAPAIATSRADATAPADIAPEVATALYSIAADGDEAIRQLTALQEWARDAVRLCGGKAAR